MRVPCTGLQRAQTVRISYKVPRDHDAAVVAVAVVAVVAAAVDAVVVPATLAAGSMVVVAADAANTAVVVAGSVVVTVIYHRACRHACHELYHDISDVMTAARSFLSSSLVSPNASGQGMSVCTIPFVVEHLHVD